jgi:hypothetical protein
MPELGSYGSVRGAAGNSRPYRERRRDSQKFGPGAGSDPSHLSSSNSYTPARDGKAEILLVG